MVFSGQAAVHVYLKKGLVYFQLTDSKKIYDFFFFYWLKIEYSVNE